MAAAQIDRVSSPRLRRRDVLAFGAGLAAWPAVAWAERGGCGGLAIGFCRETPADADNNVVPVTAATRLAAGDPQLARGVRVTVHGLTGDQQRLASLGVRSAELRVGFAVDGVDESRVEFRAWGYQLLPAAQFGSPISFRVPVDRGLALALEVEAFGSERFETVLVTGREAGAPKLRAGCYLIAPGASDFRPRHFDAARSAPMIGFTVEPLA